MTCTLYLLQTFPTAGGQRGGEIGDAQLLCLLGCLDKSQREALLTATSTLRFSLQSTDALTPRFVVVVAIYPLQTQRLRMAFALVLADFVFFARIDVGIIIEDGGTYTMLYQPLDDSR